MSGMSTNSTQKAENTALELPGIARKMIVEGLLSEPQALQTLSDARQAQRSFYQQVVEQKSIPVMRACEIASRVFGLPFLELDALNTDLLPADLIPHQLIEKHQALPLYLRHNTLFVAISNPGNNASLQDIKFNTNGLSISSILVDPHKLTSLIDKLLEKSGSTLSEIVSEANLEVDPDEGAGDAEALLNIDLDTPISRFVNKILQDGIRRGASDVHIEPYEGVTRIRYRIDGLLHEAINPPASLTNKIISRLKILSQLDIAERRLPQDGRMKMRLSKKHVIDFRVSTMPTLFGEKMVIRVLDTAAVNLSLDTIGMDEDQLALYQAAVNQPYGMILVTGPTGSGKTVSLYSAINLLNTPKRNVSSAEDPVEIYVNGVNQVNINEKTGLTFARVLRAFLRQDPDVIMIGEVRDLETAEIAIKAAQTGHLVLSTLHTNDAPSSLSRLVNMGVAPFNVASSVSLVIAQRLARRLCTSCRKPVKHNPEVLLRAGFAQKQLDTMDSLQFYEAEGCNNCTSGYRGRLGVFEVMPMTDPLSELVMSGASALDITNQAATEGVLTMRQSGLLRVADGLTSLQEIERVTTT